MCPRLSHSFEWQVSYIPFGLLSGCHSFQGKESILSLPSNSEMPVFEFRGDSWLDQPVCSRSEVSRSEVSRSKPLLQAIPKPSPNYMLRTSYQSDRIFFPSFFACSGRSFIHLRFLASSMQYIRSRSPLRLLCSLLRNYTDHLMAYGYSF